MEFGFGACESQLPELSNHSEKLTADHDEMVESQEVRQRCLDYHLVFNVFNYMTFLSKITILFLI